MRRIAKLTPPDSYVELLAANRTLTYEEIPTPVKDDVRRHLFREQNGLCAYCETRLDIAASKIEHFHPQSLPARDAGPSCTTRIDAANLDRASVAIGNLLLCCDGHEGEPARQTTCDTRKRNTHICDDAHNPKKLPDTVSSIIRVRGDGTASLEVFPASPEAAQTAYDDTLNLNERRLVQIRRLVFAELIAQMNKLRARRRLAHSPAATWRTAVAQRLRAQATEVPYPSTYESVADHVESGGGRTRPHPTHP
ncbi:MAG: retron system putative HNH endonuclease [Brevibacterium yomogidense]